VVGVPERGKGRESFLRRLGRYWAACDRYEATIKELIDAADDLKSSITGLQRWPRPLGGGDIAL
jgi:hypothetical protein